MNISYCYDNQAKLSRAKLLHKQLALVAKAIGLKAKQYRTSTVAYLNESDNA